MRYYEVRRHQRLDATVVSSSRMWCAETDQSGVLRPDWSFFYLVDEAARVVHG